MMLHFVRRSFAFPSLTALTLSLALLCSGCGRDTTSAVTPADSPTLTVTPEVTTPSTAPVSSEVPTEPTLDSTQPVTSDRQIRPVTDTPTQFEDYQLYIEDGIVYISQENGDPQPAVSDEDSTVYWLDSAWCDGEYLYLGRTYIANDYQEAEWDQDQGLTQTANYHRVYAICLSDGTITRISEPDEPTDLAYANGTCLYWTVYADWNCTTGSTYVYDTATGETNLVRSDWCVEGGMEGYLYGEQVAPGDTDPAPAQQLEGLSLTTQEIIPLCDLGSFDQVDDQSVYFFSVEDNNQVLSLGNLALDGTVTFPLASVDYNGWDYGVAAKMKDNTSFYYNYLLDDYDMSFHTYLYNFVTAQESLVGDLYL